MRNSNVKTWLVALVVALMPCVAGAAGMGRLTVLTSIGQPLVAEIDLVGVTAQELSSLSARFAQPEVYRQSNLQYNPALAGARTTIEKRPNGQSYLKIATTRPVTEPFIDLLIELTWSSGRLSREYTALLDPPGIPPAPPAPVVATAPAVVPAPAPERAPQPPAAVAAEPTAPVPAAVEPSAPVAAAAPAVSTPAVSTPAAAAPIMAGSREYGPIERGETLGKIARSVMPEGVTLEQMLVALYRTNQEAFIRNNLNLVRAGRILRVPDRDEVAAISRGDAVQEYRTHVADWNAYRQKLAEAAVTVPAEGRTAVSGKITTKVADKAAGGAPKDVVKLSKGEPPGKAAGKGKPRSNAERIRMLEEEAVAREKALAEANSRVTQLETTIQNMKKLAELRSPGMAAAQQQAAAQKPAVKPAPKPEAAKVAEPAAKPEARKPAAVAAAKPAAPVPAETPVAAQPAPATPATAPASPPVAAAQPKPKPAPQKREPELMDQVLEAATDPLYLGTGGVIVLGGLAFWMMRRRRSRAGGGDSPPIAPRLSTAAATAAGAAATTEDSSAAPTATTPASATGDDVDPMQEAEVYIQYGRDGQAEEILKEAVARDPQRQDVQLKLLEIYAARNDKTAFGKIAGDLNQLTGGAGETWLKAAAMGYTLDPANRLYDAGKDAATSTVAASAGSTTDIDLDLGGGGGAGTTTDITLEAGSMEAADRTAILDLGAMDARRSAQGQPAPAMPDFTLEVPAAGSEAQPDIALDSPAPTQDSNVIDFQIDLPKITAEPSTVTSKPAAASGDDGGLEFKLDGLNLNLESEPKTQAGAGSGEKDGHWYDVQTKFDLAKAYQEMGDKDGAKEILQEVIKEGDAEQKAQAQTLLNSLG